MRATITARSTSRWSGARRLSLRGWKTRIRPASTTPHYEPLTVEGNVGGRQRAQPLFQPGSKTVGAEFDNIFVMRFDEQGSSASNSANGTVKNERTTRSRRSEVMNYRILGRTGVKVSPLCMGTMTFGDSADEAESARMFRRCREVGINFFDCANGYAGGRSEEILGKLIADCRDDLVITTKVRLLGRRRASTGAGSSRRHIQMQVEASLKRLKTDRIDVYFIHRFDPDTPIEDDGARARRSGAAGQNPLPGGEQLGGVADQPRRSASSTYEGLARFECLQPMYNLVKRQAEVEILPLAQSEQIGVIPYSPLGGGLLTGQVRGRAAPTRGA